MQRKNGMEIRGMMFTTPTTAKGAIKPLFTAIIFSELLFNYQIYSLLMEVNRFYIDCVFKQLIFL
jgi:hypothetical protein